MPPRGVKKGSKRERQYEHIKDSEEAQGAPTDRAEEIAARTVNKERARSGESRAASTQSKDFHPVDGAGCVRGNPGRAEGRASSCIRRRGRWASTVAPR